MVNVKMISERIARIRENLRLLRKLGESPEDRFINDWVQVRAAERLFQITIEACLDIGNHLIAEKGLARPEDYKGIFRILSAADVLEKEISNKLMAMAEFRNLLVHGYSKVDAGELYRYIHENLADVEEFIQVIADLVSSEDSDEEREA